MHVRCIFASGSSFSTFVSSDLGFFPGAERWQALLVQHPSSLRWLIVPEFNSDEIHDFLAQHGKVGAPALVTAEVPMFVAGFVRVPQVFFKNGALGAPAFVADDIPKF